MNILVKPEDFLTEARVLEMWPGLSARELRRARKSNPPQIGFYAFPKSREGLATRLRKCRNTSIGSI